MQFQIGDFCSLSSGVKVWCTSDDFVNDLVTIIPPGIEQVKTNLIRGDVILDRIHGCGIRIRDHAEHALAGRNVDWRAQLRSGRL